MLAMNAFNQIVKRNHTFENNWMKQTLVKNEKLKVTVGQWNRP